MAKIYLSSPHMSGNEMKYIHEAFDTNWIAPLGNNVTMFEKEMCQFIGRTSAVALSSGTAAIHMGLKILGVKEDDIVFCSSFTFSGSCNPVLYLGARPVFIDSDNETWNMDPEALKKAYKKYPFPKALITVNLYGAPANYKEILKIAKEHNTPVLEDSAESLGSKYLNKQTGNFGDISIFSFNGNKIITTSGGGMLMCDNEEIKQKVLFWATQSREPFPWYEHKEVGYNYRLSNICAGIGRGQLEVIEERVKQKKNINKLYKKFFKDNKYITFMPESKDSDPNNWLTVIKLNDKCKVNFMDIINELQKNDVESRPAWKPMHLQPIFRNCEFFTSAKNGSISETIFNKSVCLPSDTKMTEGQVECVSNVVNKVILSEKGI